MQHGGSIAFQLDRLLLLMADFSKSLDDVFFGIGHIVELHCDGILVVLHRDDRLVHTRLYVLLLVRHVLEQ